MEKGFVRRANNDHKDDLPSKKKTSTFETESFAIPFKAVPSLFLL